MVRKPGSSSTTSSRILGGTIEAISVLPLLYGTPRLGGCQFPPDRPLWACTLGGFSYDPRETYAVTAAGRKVPFRLRALWLTAALAAGVAGCSSSASDPPPPPPP